MPDIGTYSQRKSLGLVAIEHGGPHLGAACPAKGFQAVKPVYHAHRAVLHQDRGQPVEDLAQRLDMVLVDANLPR